MELQKFISFRCLAIFNFWHLGILLLRRPTLKSDFCMLERFSVSQEFGGDCWEQNTQICGVAAFPFLVGRVPSLLKYLFKGPDSIKGGLRCLHPCFVQVCPSHSPNPPFLPFWGKGEPESKSSPALGEGSLAVRAAKLGMHSNLKTDSSSGKTAFSLNDLAQWERLTDSMARW